MPKNLLYTLRNEKGFTLQQLAQMIGVKSPTLSKWEDGAIMPSEKKLEILSKALEVDYDVLESIAPRCSVMECRMRVYQHGFCKTHFYRYYHKDVRPIITEEMSSAETMGERLKLLRERKSLSVEQLAQNFGVTCSTIEAWECNWIKPSLHMLLDIAGYFFVSTRFLERGVVDE